MFQPKGVEMKRDVSQISNILEDKRDRIIIRTHLGKNLGHRRRWLREKGISYKKVIKSCYYVTKSFSVIGLGEKNFVWLTIKTM